MIEQEIYRMKNSIDYKAILEKKKPTGYEVGLLLFASVLHQQEQRQKGEQATDLYTQKEFTKTESRLTEEERINYEPYRLLYNSTLDAFSNLLSKFTLFTSSFYCVYYRVRLLYAELSRQLHAYATPLIVSESEYNTLYKQTLERLQHKGIDKTPNSEDIATTLKGEHATPESYYKHFRALGGLAVIKDPYEEILSKEGNFNDLEEEHTLINFFDDLLESDKDIIKQQYRNIKEVISTLFAYSELIGIIEEVYKIPTLQEKLDARKTRRACTTTVKLLEKEILRLNPLIVSDYFNSEEKERNLQIIKEVFPKFNLEALHPTEKAKKAITKELEEVDNDPEKVKAYRDLTPFIERLKKPVE